MSDAFSGIRCFMLDMDGTFYLGERLIDGSLEFIEALKRSGRDYLFLTNNSSRSADYYVGKLRGLGLETTAEHVLTSGQATAMAMTRDRPGQRAHVLGNELLLNELSGMGVVIDQDNPDYIIVGYDTTLDFEKMRRVCDFARAGLPMIATHPDLNCPTETGFMPDIGAILAFIEASAGRRPDMIVGKPYRAIVDAAVKRTGLEPSAMAMVGDRLYTDVKTGLDHGMRAILVLSGETTQEMLVASQVKPDMVFDRLSDMIELL